MLSYWSSRNRPALDAVGVVADFVVVRVSNRNAKRDIFCDRGVDEYDRIDERRWDRNVVFPDPDSPRKITA